MKTIYDYNVTKEELEKILNYSLGTDSSNIKEDEYKRLFTEDGEKYAHLSDLMFLRGDIESSEKFGAMVGDYWQHQEIMIES